MKTPRERPKTAATRETAARRRHAPRRQARKYFCEVVGGALQVGGLRVGGEECRAYS